MTPNEKELVAASFEKVKPIAREAGLLFYDRLFTLDPSLRPLFRRPIEEQTAKLMQALALAVGSLQRLDALVPVLEEMGRRHAGYGVRDEHYETVGAALLWTLEQGLGEEFTPAVAGAWTAAYQLLAGVMRGAASGRAAA